MAAVIRSRPRPHSGWASALGWANLVQVLARWHQERSARRQLARLSDRALADLGLQRGDLDRSLAQPIWRPTDYQALERQRRRNGARRGREAWLAPR